MAWPGDWEVTIIFRELISIMEGNENMEYRKIKLKCKECGKIVEYEIEADETEKVENFICTSCAETLRLLPGTYE